MSIQFDCENCQKKLKVPQSAAGKRGRCNQCGHLNTIPAVASAETIIDTAAANDGGAPVATPIGSGSGDETYNVKSAVNGAVFGPADSATLQKWLDEGRITPNCQLQETGTQGWTMASAMFPALGSTATANLGDAFSEFQQTSQTQTKPGELNPYAPAPNAQLAGPWVGQELVPTAGNIGFCISHGWKVVTANFGIIFLALLTIGVLALLLAGATGGVQTLIEANGINALTGILSFVMMLVFGLIILWLGLGYTNLVCQLCRGQKAEYGMLFGRGSRLPLTVLFYVIVSVPLFILQSVAGYFALTAMAGNQGPPDLTMIFVPFLLIFLFQMLLSLFVWPIFFLLADTEMGFECFGKGLAISTKNFLIMIPIFFVVFLLAVLGLLVCYVGLLFTIPFGHTIMATAYLNMSGQLKPR